jgi:hypothetical protein
MMKSFRSVSLVVTLSPWWLLCDAFVAPKLRSSGRQHVSTLFETMESELGEPAMNPDNPILPELKGDFDWDKKFEGDSDWITENVPGKIVLNEVELAAQVTALNRLEEKWRKERLIQEYEESRTVGWVQNAELLNGRFAMFFLATGLLTEYWTDVTLPGQVEELLRIGGFIGFD